MLPTSAAKARAEVPHFATHRPCITWLLHLVLPGPAPGPEGRREAAPLGTQSPPQAL